MRVYFESCLTFSCQTFSDKWAFLTLVWNIIDQSAHLISHGCTGNVCLEVKPTNTSSRESLLNQTGWWNICGHFTHFRHKAYMLLPALMHWSTMSRVCSLLKALCQSQFCHSPEVHKTSHNHQGWTTITSASCDTSLTQSHAVKHFGRPERMNDECTLMKWMNANSIQF